MGAANFAAENASKIFSIELSEHWHEAQEDVEWYKERVMELMHARCALDDRLECFEDDGDDGSRSYTGSYFCKISAEVIADDHIGYMECRLMLRSAYYEGANFDYDLEYYVDDDYSYDRLDDLAEVSDEYHSAMCEMDELVREYVEAVLTEVTNPLNVVGVMSNGVAIYEPAKQK